MRDVCLFVPQRHRSDEPLHLNRLPGEALSNERSLGDHPLPRLGLGLSRLEHLEHLVLSDSSDLGKRDGVLGSSVFTSLLDGGGERFGILDPGRTIPKADADQSKGQIEWTCAKLPAPTPQQGTPCDTIDRVEPGHTF